MTPIKILIALKLNKNYDLVGDLSNNLASDLSNKLAGDLSNNLSSDLSNDLSSKSICYDGDTYLINKLDKSVLQDEYDKWIYISKKEFRNNFNGTLPDDINIRANIFCEFIKKTKGYVSYVDINDLLPRYSEQDVKYINYIIYEINMLYEAKYILQKGYNLCSNRKKIFIEYVLSKYNKFNYTYTSYEIFQLIDSFIKKLLFKTHTFIGNKNNSIIKLCSKYVADAQYNEYERESSATIIYKDPSRPNVNYIQLTSVSMARQTSHNSISFGLG
jgi:hypothetical protein